LEAQFPATVDQQPELLAHHYTEAGLTEQAVHYWHMAGQRASERSAHVEAISHLAKGLELLKTLPDTPERTQREVDMHIAIGASLIATKGWAAPEVRETYTSAQQLCQHLEDPYQLFPVLWGLWSYHLVRAELQTAHALGAQLLTLAQHTQDPVMLLMAHRTLGATLYSLGVFTAAHAHLAQGIALYDAKHPRASVLLYGEDAGVTCRCHAAFTLWVLGYPAQGLARSQEAVTLAQQMAHPHSLAYALGMAAAFHQCRREWQTVQKHAEAAIILAQEQGFPFWIGWGALWYGWGLAQQGKVQEGIEQLTQGLTAWRATGAEAGRPSFLSLLAEAHGNMGQLETGLTVLTEALTLVDSSGERFYEAELHRLNGELLLQQSSDTQADAETCFTQAIAIAQNQQAKSWELRAATSLARLWQQQGKRQVAYDLLAPVYHWFTEGFDTADLKDAKALLHELSEGR
jgi:predicted ATPase